MPTEIEAADNTSRIVDSFGGIRPMAAKLAIPVTTVQGWKKRGIIPQPRHAEILAVAEREGIVIDPAALAATDNGAGMRTDFRTEPAADPSSEIIPPPRIPVSSLSASSASLSSASASSSGPTPPIAAQPVVIRRGSPAAGAAVALSVMVAIGVAGGGFAAWHFYLEPLRNRVAALEARPGATTDDDLNRRLAKLESQPGPSAASGTFWQPTVNDADRLAALEHQLVEIKANAAQTEQLAKSLSDLQLAAGGRELLAQSIRDIQSSTAAAQGEVERLSGQVSAFGARLDQVDVALADRRQQALRAEATVLAVGQLRTVLSTSKPFTKELAAVRTLGNGDPDMAMALDPLQPLADNGVPTQDDLTRDFGRLAPSLVRSSVVGDGQHWWRQALYHIESVISIRRVGDNVPGDSTEAVVARTEAKLDEDDLAGAIGALQALSGLPADLASSWIHDAEHRVAVGNAEDELTRIAISHVSTGGSTPAPAAPVAK